MTRLFQGGTKSAISQRTAQEPNYKKYYLVWQAAHVASENKGCLRTRCQLQVGQSHRKHFHLRHSKSKCVRRRGRRIVISPHFSFSVSLQICRVANLSLPDGADGFLWTFRAETLVVCVRVFLFSCVCMNHPGVTPPYVGG